MSSEQKIEALLSLPAPERYDYFIKRVAELETVWGLYQDGWALAATDDGRSIFPVWSERQFAELCATRDWAGYEPAEIPLQDFIEELLPKLQADGVELGVFYTPNDRSVVPRFQQVIDDINHELERY